MIEPLIKVLYFKATTHFDFVVIFANLKARNTFVEVVDFWLIFPLAGLLLLRLRMWTYFGFMSVLGYIMYGMTTYEKYTWPYNADTPHLYNYLVAALSAVVFVGFLFPQIRRPFFDRRLRWWEPNARYATQINCRVHGTHLTFPSQILNMSQTGAFLQESPYLKVGDKLEVTFYFLGEPIQLPVEVIHKSELKGMHGYGVHFTSRNLSHSLKIARVISVLKRTNILFKDLKAEGVGA